VGSTVLFQNMSLFLVKFLSILLSDKA